MTKFFLDSCDPAQTAKAIKVLGSLNGQTTNPSLLLKNPKLQGELQSGKISQKRLLELYKEAIIDISKQIPNGSISIEVYADHNSSVTDLLFQAQYFYGWINNAHIKFPTTPVGLEAGRQFVNSGGKVNMTLVFNQEQALAVHLATLNAKNKGDVFVSPFVGRLDDIGLNGMDLVRNVLKMYKELDSKVEVLGASVRTLRHFDECLKCNCDIITAPLSTLEQYQKDKIYNLEHDQAFVQSLKPIDYLELDYNTDYHNINIQHELTDVGLIKFANDWNSVLL